MGSFEQHINSSLSNTALVYGAQFPLTDVGISYEDLFARYVNSSYGLEHALSEPRYTNRYGYDRLQMLDDLGDDVHPVFHMRHTHDVPMLGIIKVQQQSPEVRKFKPAEIITGRLTAYFHDMGECVHEELASVVDKTVGDKAWGTKTEDDEAREAAIRGYIYSKLYTDIPQELLVAVDSAIVEPEESYVGQAFAVAERVGYYLTAIRAGKVALSCLEEPSANPTRDELSLSQLSRLAVNVSNNHHAVLEQEAEHFPFVGVVIAENETAFRAIQSKLGPAV